jgi:hypothetical protein
MSGAGARLLALLALAASLILAPGLARPAAAPDAGEDDEDEAEEAALLPWGFELGAELETAYERQADAAAGEFTFDEVDVGWSGAWLSLELGIKYDTESDRGLLLEDAALRVDGGERWPLFCAVGRQVLPFGRFETRFIEDPLVALAGEIDDAALVLGVAGEWGELALGGLRGEHAPDGELDTVVSLLVSPWPRWGLGLSWTQDLGEAVELRELRAERREEGQALPREPGRSPVAALGLFASREGRDWAWQVEAVAALAAFPAGALDAGGVQPVAVNLEVARRLASRWEAAIRVEAASELPGAPEHQVGLAASYAPASTLAITAEVLRGGFADEPARTLLSLQITLEF